MGWGRPWKTVTPPEKKMELPPLLLFLYILVSFMWGKKAFFYSQKQRGNIDPIKIINFPPQRMPQLQGCSTLNSKHIPHQPSTGVLNPRFHHQPSADVSFFPLRRHLWRHRKCKYGMGELAFSDSSATRFKEKKNDAARRLKPKATNGEKEKDSS